MHRFLVASVLVLAACSGEMRGVVRGTGEPVSIAYTQGMESDTLSTTIDGEAFTGRAVMADARAVTGKTFGNIYGAAGTAAVNTGTIGLSSSGNMLAMLLGNNGSTLRCQLNYASAFAETSAGGVGICSHSDGRIIDVQW